MSSPQTIKAEDAARSGYKGAGGYREHDILVITEDGNRNITGFPYGPEHNIIRS